MTKKDRAYPSVCHTMSPGSGAALTDQHRWSWWIIAEQAMTCAASPAISVGSRARCLCEGWCESRAATSGSPDDGDERVHVRVRVQVHPAWVNQVQLAPSS